MTLREFIDVASKRFFVQEINEWKDGERLHYLKRLIPPGAWFSAPISELEMEQELSLHELQFLCSQLRLPLSAFGIVAD